jgi:tetratricopeptide (TPR) repeat protein
MNDAARNFRERWDEVSAAEKSWAFRIELLSAFVRDFPEFSPGWRQLGRTLAELSRFEEAEQSLQMAMRLAAADGLLWVYADFGTMFRHKGDPASAEVWFRKTIEHSPEDTQGYVLLGGILARHGRLDEAEEIYRRGAHCKTGCIDEVHHNLGLVLRALGRYDEAGECFETALKLDPQYKQARLALRDVKRAIRFVQSRDNAAHPSAQNKDAE